MNRELAMEIAEFVNARNGIWEAYDQGRWSFACGIPMIQNPHACWHINFSHWNRGWIDEQNRSFVAA